MMSSLSSSKTRFAIASGACFILFFFASLLPNGTFKTLANYDKEIHFLAFLAVSFFGYFTLSFNIRKNVLLAFPALVGLSIGSEGLQSLAKSQSFDFLDLLVKNNLLSV